MKPRRIVVGQKVDPVKKQRARELRRELTPEERILWHYLRDRNTLGFKFRSQQVINGFITDFYCHAIGLVIEVDGGIHQMQQDYDKERDRIIQSRGLHVLRVSNEDIHNDLYNIISQIRQTCLKLVELQKAK